MTKTIKTKNKKKKLETMQALLAKESKEDLGLKIGEKIIAKIDSITSSRVFVNIKGRGMGYFPKTELLTTEQDLAEGDEIEGIVINPEDEDGYVILSKSLDLETRRKYPEDSRNLPKDKVFKVEVIEANRGGLIVRTDKIKGFLPVSQLSPDHYPRVEGGDKEKILTRLKKLVGTELEAKIIDAKEGERNLSSDIIFSEKSAILEDKKEKLKGLKVGDVVEGEISGIVDFGIFLHFDNIEGLVHISEISWERVEDIRKMFKVGEKIKAKIIGIDDNRISLSIKQMKKDPWLDKVKKYKVGQKVKGVISKILPFGAFAELKEGIEGLIHISELGLSVDPSQYFSLGEEVSLKIVGIEPSEHKINLSLCKAKSEIKDRSIKGVSGLTGKQIENLQKAGVRSFADLAKLKEKDLEKIKGIGKKTAKKIAKIIKENL